MTTEHEITAVKAKAALAADIIRALDAGGLSVRIMRPKRGSAWAPRLTRPFRPLRAKRAADHTGIPYDEFRRIRDGALAGFTEERLRAILDKFHR